MHRIIAIAQQLSKEGKTPNTALIKARLPKNIALPLIIEGLRLWRDDPYQEIHLEKFNTVPPDTSKKNLDALIKMQIDEKLAPLYTQIKALQQRIILLEESH
ncbi:hypothetical protein [Psychromonas sp. CD1]|uniref:hypothetical protein n=1 Tax=Psychromonas sp. CD1 TaxID=1979839 RepID=UPI000B9A74E1|nr:hypothetical protein [Psychromonas sp. CD1]